MNRGLRWVLSIASTMALLAFSRPLQAGFECHSQVTSCGNLDTSCIKTPTSLINVTALADTSEGWDAGGLCGTKPCYIMGLPTRCACGNPLSSGVCGLSGGGGCDCGMGTPCEFSVTQLNQMLDAGEKSQASGGFEQPSLPPVAPTSSFLPKRGTPEIASRGTEALRRLQSFYAGLSTVSLQSGAWIWKPERSGDGTFEYATSGSKYRVRVTIDPLLGFASGIDSAYDGDSYQLLVLDDLRLSLWRDDPGRIPAPLPNPLFLPVAFLGAQDDACSPCELSTSAVLDEKRWAARVGMARGLAAKSGGDLELLLPGGTLQGAAYYFRVIVAPKREIVQRIELVRPDGHVISTLDLNDYRRPTGSAVLFPHHIVLTGWNDKGQRSASIHYMIKNLQVNPTLDASRFTISRDQAKVIIDETNHTFLKHPLLKKE